MNVSEEIKYLISQLSDDAVKLSTLLVKVKILASNLKSETLKQWVEYQIKGYPDNNVPEYRKFKGNWIMEIVITYPYVRKQNIPITSNLDIFSIFEIIKQPLREIEEIEQNPQLLLHLPNSTHPYFQQFIKIIGGYGEAQIQNIYTQIPIGYSNSIITNCKNELLDFLLEINDQFGENKNLSIMENKEKFEEIAKNTFGNITIHGNGKLNLNIGNHNQLTQGNNNNFGEITKENVFDKLRKMLPQLKAEVQDIPDEDDKERLSREVIVLETQLQQEQPEPKKIGKILGFIKSLGENITWGVAGNFVYDMLKSAATVLGTIS